MKKKSFYFFIFLFFAAFSAQAKLFGLQWKGQINTYRLGALLVDQPGFTKGIGPSVSGYGLTSDAHLESTAGVVTDSSGNIYVADKYRIIKYDSTGNSVGWIGGVAKTPTGGAAGCLSAAIYTYTPGWCTGGSAGPDFSGGSNFISANSLMIDSAGNLYATELNGHRILKFSSSGSFIGWIGKIAAQPTGGAAGCSTAAVGAVTPGWCTGGAASGSSGTGNGMFYYAGDLAFDASSNFYVADTYNSRIQKFNSSGVFQGWIGRILTKPTGGATNCTTNAVGTATPGWCTGGTAQSGTGDGMLDKVGGLTVDQATGDIYATDFINSRIQKYNSSGVFQGWTGLINTKPTSGATGCATNAVGTATPGWCKGGTATSGSGDGASNRPASIKLDSSLNIYIADSNNYRVSKYNSAGVFQGWIGLVTTSPTGGASGCNGLAAGLATPGWCTGGSANYGFDDGMISNLMGEIFIDSAANLFIANGGTASKVAKVNLTTGVLIGNIQAIGVGTSWHRSTAPNVSAAGASSFTRPGQITFAASGNFYVADSGNGRVMKFNSAGIYQGWIGTILTSPTGGASGCAGAAANTITPGWCTGGTSTQGSNIIDGALGNATGVAVDVSENIYVADNWNSRISKFNSSGVFQGWIGAVQTTPTGGAAGCTGISYPDPTPGWCTGGSPAYASSDGGLAGIYTVTVDATGNIYGVSVNNNRIVKFNSSGVYQGWLGGIGTSPTGGDAGCAGKAVGTSTNGWCTGGAANYGSGDGFIYGPYAMTFDSSGNFYVAENYNHRISKFNAAGLFQGWIGTVGSTSPTGGAAGCTTTTNGSKTPGWCKGGTTVSGYQNGDFYNPRGVAVDPSGNVYIANTGNGNLVKFNSSGVYQGWFGGISSTTTGGDPGCINAAQFVASPGWCKGGNTYSGSFDGLFLNPQNLSLDKSGNLYVIDVGGARVMRISLQGR